MITKMATEIITRKVIDTAGINTITVIETAINHQSYNKNIKGGQTLFFSLYVVMNVICIAPLPSWGRICFSMKPEFSRYWTSFRQREVPPLQLSLLHTIKPLHQLGTKGKEFARLSPLSKGDQRQISTSNHGSRPALRDSG